MSSDLISKKISLYDVLGVSKNVTNDEIKTVYFNLAKKCHPDLAKDEEERLIFSKRFKELKLAYVTLIDKSKRNLYDSSQSASYNELTTCVDRDTMYHISEKYKDNCGNFNNNKFIEDFNRDVNIDIPIEHKIDVDYISSIERQRDIDSMSYYKNNVVIEKEDFNENFLKLKTKNITKNSIVEISSNNVPAATYFDTGTSIAEFDSKCENYIGFGLDVNNEIDEPKPSVSYMNDMLSKCLDNRDNLDVKTVDEDNEYSITPGDKLYNIDL